MTKQIRIENADNSDHKVAVEVWQEAQGDTPAALLNTVDLSSPTQMVSMTVWKGHYLVVKEVSE
jgi:hypothetical protein